MRDGVDDDGLAQGICHMPSQLLMSHSTISASSSRRKVFRWMVSPLPSPFGFGSSTPSSRRRKL